MLPRWIWPVYAALAGLVTGLAVSFALPLAGYARPFGLHDGLVGGFANLLVCVVWSQLAVVRERSAVSEATA